MVKTLYSILHRSLDLTSIYIAFCLLIKINNLAVGNPILANDVYCLSI